MEELLRRLSEIPKGQSFENADKIIGKDIYLLHSLMLNSKEEFSTDVEKILLSLITANNGDLSPVTANGIGVCLLEYYKAQKKQDIWNFILLMTDEIKRYNITAIIVLGIVSRDLGSLFKAKLFAHISTLAASPNPEQFLYICQCFRRIIIGTGTFLDKAIPTIFLFVKRCFTATAENLRNEAIKTIPVLCKYAKIDFQKLLPIITPTLITESALGRYTAAKSLAKLLFTASNNDLSFITKNILLLLKNEKNAHTVCSSLFICLRFFEPIFLVSKLKTYSRFIYNMASLQVSVKNLCFIVSSATKAFYSVVGSTAGKAVCAQLIELLQADSLTIPNALVILIAMQNSELSSSILQQGLKCTYPLLECNTKEIRDLAISFFGTLNTKSQRIGGIYLNTFLVLICEIEKSSSLIGFSSSIAMLTNEKNAQTVLETCDKLITKGKLYSPVTNAAFILATGLAANHVISQKAVEAAAKFATKVSVSLRNPEETLSAVEYLAVFMNATKHNEKIIKSIPTFLQRVLPYSQHFTDSCIFAVFSLAKSLKFNENISLLLAKSAIQIISRIFSLEDFDIDTVISPFTNNIDIVHLLYGTKPTRNFHSIFSACLGMNCDSHCSGACRVLIETFPDIMKGVSQKERKPLIDLLFENNNEDNSVAGLLMLMRSLLQKRSTYVFLPSNTLPCLLTIKTKNESLNRIIASCVGRWLHYYPMLVPAVFTTFEKAKKQRVLFSLIIAEASALFAQDEFKDRALKLCCNIVQKSSSAESLYALSQLIKESKIEESSEVVEALEHVLFLGKIRTVSQMTHFCSAVNLLKKAPKEFKECCSYCLLSYNTLHSSAQFIALTLDNDCGEYTNKLVEQHQKLESQPMLFVSTLALSTSIAIAPLMFTLLQQLGLKRIADSLIKEFLKDPVVPIWTDLCKRIILNNCVPPAETVGKNKITPTRAVIVSAMHISALLVKKIRENFPQDINCIDTLIAIAFNAIQMKDSKVDVHAFAIVTSVITNFSDVCTNGEPFLTLFMAQLNPMFIHACEETRKLQNVADYIIEYLDLQKHFDASDAAKLAVERIGKVKMSHSTNLIYARITSVINEISVEQFEHLRENFITAAYDVIKSVAQQEYKLSELRKELVPFVKAFLKTIDDAQQRRILLLLIFAQLESIGINDVLKCATEFARRKLLTPDDIEYLIPYLSTVETKEGKNENDFENNSFTETAFNDEMEEHTVYVSDEKEEENILQEFIINASLNAEGNNFLNTRMLLLSCAMSQQPICFHAIGFLLHNAGSEEVRTLLPSVFNACSLSSSTDKRAEAICFLILSHLNNSQSDSIKIVDALLNELCNHRIEEVKKNIIQILYLFHSHELKSMKKLAALINKEIFPTGVTLLIELLSDERTKEIALNLMKRGAIDDLDSMEIKDVPRVLYFLNLLLGHIINKEEENKEKVIEAIARTAMHCIALTDGIKDRQKVISIATPLFKALPEESVKNAFNNNEESASVISALTPPRKAHASAIKLISFGKTTRRSSQNQGWQTLSIEDD